MRSSSSFVYSLIERTETRNQKTKKYDNKPPKTKVSNRNVYLSEDALYVLDNIFSVRDKYGIISDFLFTDRDGNRLNCPRFAKAIESINNHTGLLYKRSMHDIRRTYASVQYANGVPPQLIQRQLGHETLQQTFDYIKNLITEQEGKKYLEKAVLFNSKEEQEDIGMKIGKDGTETNEKNNVIDFNSVL